MTAFAWPDDLATRLRRVFTSEESQWVEVLLDDAAADIRLITGHVYPPVEATYIAYPSGGWVDIHQPYLRSVDSVTRDGVPVTYTRRDNAIQVDCDEPVTVTISYGLSEPPPELVALNCVMVAQALTLVEAGLGLTVGGLSSVALDDFKVAFTDGGAGTGSTIPEATAARLATVYGAAAYTTGARL